MSITNVRIGDCELYFDPLDGSGERFLGETKGGTKLAIERTVVELTVDKYGDAPVDVALKGNKIKITAMLAEPTTKNISQANPEGLYAAVTSPADAKMGIGRKAGFLFSTVAGQLRCHPRRNTPSNRNEDLYIWKAFSGKNVELDYTFDKQRLLDIEFNGLIDETQVDGALLGQVGDNAIS